METSLRDDAQSWLLQADGTWVREERTDGATPFSAQATLLARLGA